MRGEMWRLVARVGLFDTAVLSGGVLVGGGPSWTGGPWARVGLGAVVGLAAGVLLADAAWAWYRRQATGVMRRQAVLIDYQVEMVRWLTDVVRTLEAYYAASTTAERAGWANRLEILQAAKPVFAAWPGPDGGRRDE